MALEQGRIVVRANSSNVVLAVYTEGRAAPFVLENLRLKTGNAGTLVTEAGLDIAGDEPMLPAGIYIWTQAPQAGTNNRGAEASTSGDDMNRRLASLELGFNSMKPLLESFLERTTYTEDKATEKTKSTFKQDLRNRYSKHIVRADGARIFCMITHKYLPQRLVIGAHLWKRSFDIDKNIMGLTNIDDPRNGLLLLKAVEWAFDSSQLCFVPNGRGQFQPRILNENIRRKSLVQQTEELYQGVDGPGRLSQDELGVLAKELGEMTFEDLEWRFLRSDGGPAPNPYKRVLYYQAVRASQKAVEEGWRDEPLEIADFMSEGDWRRNISFFLQRMGEGPQDGENPLDNLSLGAGANEQGGGMSGDICGEQPVGSRDVEGELKKKKKKKKGRSKK